MCALENEESGVLVARAVPLAIPNNIEHNNNISNQVAKDDIVHVSKPKTKPVDALTESLNGLQISKNENTAIKSKNKNGQRRSDAAISPADFVNLQSMRSSALARKPNTTSKFSRDCRNLFADLLLSDEELKNGVKEKTTQKSKESKKGSKVIDATKNATELKEEPPKDKVEKQTEAETQKVETKSESLSSSSASIEDKEEEEKEEKERKMIDNKTESKVLDEEDDEQDENYLLSRGPVRSNRISANYHPYSNGSLNSNCTGGAMYAAAPLTTIYDPTSLSANAYNYGYACGTHSTNSTSFIDSRESTPDTVHSDLGYSSATSPRSIPNMNLQYGSGTSNGSCLTAESNALFNGENCGTTGNDLDDLCMTLRPSDLESLMASNNNMKTDSSECELPDALSDFILKYSRRYTSSETSMSSNNSPQNLAGLSASASPITYTGNFDGALPNSDEIGGGANSLCNSPLSAVSAPKCSPAAPYGGIVDQPFQLTPISSIDQKKLISKAENSRLNSQYTSDQSAQVVARIAKERLRALISDDDMDKAWAWTCKCIQNYPGALCYQDTDRDTLLHIVTLHLDLAKIYALVEQMLKMEMEYNDSPSRQKPFDMPNRFGETPLFLAVEKRQSAVVDYLLEAGAYPDTQNFRAERDAPLHYASARGMTNIVQILCSNSKTNVNLQNGMGLTPLLYAVKNHGVLEEESQLIIDNSSTIETLLKYKADPMVADATNGKTVIHYAIERLDAKLIEIIQSNLTAETMNELVNTPDLCNETPMHTLQQLGAGDKALRSKLYLTLITSGAVSN